MRFYLHDSHMEKKEKELKKIDWVLKNSKLDGATRWHIFQAIFRSKVSYGANIITSINKPSMEK